MVSQRFSLTQQLLEQHPGVYLLFLVLQPNEDKPLFPVSYPNPTINSIGHVREEFTFASNEPCDILRAMVPILSESDNGCDYVIDRIQTLADVNRFRIEDRRPGLAPIPFDKVEEVVEESAGAFQLAKIPMQPGTIRLLSSTAATSPYGSDERLVIQPQLVPVQNYHSTEAMPSNGVLLADMEESRGSFTPLAKTAFGIPLAAKIPPNPIGATLLPPSALSEEIQIMRSFQNRTVLSKIGILLGGDGNHFQLGRRELSQLVHSEDTCICVMNEYMPVEMMRPLDAFPQTWSIRGQKQALSFLMGYKESFSHASESYKSSETRYLCDHHVKHLSKKLGLLVGFC